MDILEKPLDLKRHLYFAPKKVVRNFPVRNFLPTILSMFLC